MQTKTQMILAKGGVVKEVSTCTSLLSSPASSRPTTSLLHQQQQLLPPKMRNTDLLSSQMTALQINKDRSPTEFCITTDLLIPGRGKPIPSACLIVKDTKITHVGPASDVLTHYSHLPKTHVKVLMPGMWDCHVHLVGIHKIASDAFVQMNQSPILAGARCARDCMLLLDAGFTSVRINRSACVNMALG